MADFIPMRRKITNLSDLVGFFDEVESVQGSKLRREMIAEGRDEIYISVVLDRMRRSIAQARVNAFDLEDRHRRGEDTSNWVAAELPLSGVRKTA